VFGELCDKLLQAGKRRGASDNTDGNVEGSSFAESLVAPTILVSDLVCARSEVGVAQLLPNCAAGKVGDIAIVEVHLGPWAAYGHMAVVIDFTEVSVQWCHTQLRSTH
jgi:hypothetical protein